MIPEFEQQNYDFDIEASVIGWCMVDQSAAVKMFDLLPEHFHSALHLDIWQAICQLRKLADFITPFTITPLLKDYPSFAEAGGHKYLAGCIVAIQPHGERQVKYLINLAKKRLFEDAKIFGDVRQVARAASEILQSEKAHSFQTVSEVTNNIIESIKQNEKPMPTGLSKLDEAMGGGLYAKKSYGFAARKKVGKTILAGTISYQLNQSNIKHLFICGEMSPEEIHSRNLSRATNTFPSAFRSEYAQSASFHKKIEAAIFSIPNKTLYRNAPGLTFDELRAIMETATDIHGVKGVILDYWQLVGGKQKNQSDAAHLDEVAQWIADFCRKKNIWSIVMAQINQEGNTRGGEGLRLAFDQVYHMKAPEHDPSRSGRYLEMMDTRYTKWMNIGTDSSPGLFMREEGPYFSEQCA